jgi:hypothetical protein
MRNLALAFSASMLLITPWTSLSTRTPVSLAVGQTRGAPATVAAAAARYTFAVAGATTQSESIGQTFTVYPMISRLPDGSTVSSYALPGGGVMTTTTPLPSFDPLAASDAQLAEYDFPPRPSDAAGLQEWTNAMSSYTSDDPPVGPLQVAVAGTAAQYSTCPPYCNWGGYTAGTWNIHSHTYVAVKSVFYVPSNSGTCSSSNNVGLWIGLGGTTGNDDLDQQGIACGNPYLGGTNSYKAFLELCCPVSGGDPVYFCGYNWTLPAGDKIYQNMSFQTSSNTAYFYIDDETTGTIHSCSRTPPSGWSWDLNTSEWIAEAPAGVAVDFHSVAFSDALTELSSNSTWVSLGSQTVTKVIDGAGYVGGHLYECIVPGSISGGTAFTDSWVASACY